MRGQNKAFYARFPGLYSIPVCAQHTSSISVAKCTADGATSGAGAGARSGTALPAIVARR